MSASQQSNRVARLDEQVILQAEDFQTQLRAIASKQKLGIDEAEKRAAGCLQELAVRPEERYLNLVAKLARFMYSRSYDPILDVNTERLDALKKAAATRPLVFLWSHKSHLDSFVFMRAMYDNDFRPQPLSFAGINMNFLGFGKLAKKSGAIFVRRSFKDDQIYKLVFMSYIDFLVRKKLPLSWSIEGTRSRTGKLMPPKLGLINWVIDAYRRSACNDALLVPVSISFDQIPEIDDYVNMQRGLPKRKESLRWFVDYISGMKTRYGRIYVRFAEPIALDEALTGTSDMSAALLGDPNRPERIKTQKLAFEVCSRIENANPISGSDLVTLVLLSANGRALTDCEIREHVTEIVQLIDQRELPTAGSLHLERGKALAITLALLVETGLLQRYDKAGRAVFSIAPGKQLAAAYYRNTIIHYFLNSALAEMALARVADKALEGGDAESVQTAALALRDLLKFEFFFKTKPEFSADVADYLDRRYPDWRQPDRCTLFGQTRPLFGHSILRSFIEAYFVLASALLQLDGATVDKSTESTLINNCLALGEELLLRRRIGSESALSQPLFSNAVRLARHRELLSSDKGDLHSRRNQFAIEMDHALAAVNRLQRQYDDQQTGS